MTGFGCGCLGEPPLEPRPRRPKSPPGPTLQLARALAGRHDEVRFAHYKSGRYSLVGRFPRRETHRVWAPYLADPLWYWSVGLDMDTKRDTGERLNEASARALRRGDRDGVRRDLGLIIELSRAAGLWFLPEQSSTTGGIHVWWPSARGLHPAVVADTAVRLAALCPTLDVSPLLNPATGTLRTPGTPHVLGGRSHIMTNHLDVDTMDLVSRVELANPPEAFLKLRDMLPPRPSDEEIAEKILPQGSFAPEARRIGNPAAVEDVRAWRRTVDENVIAGRLKAHHWAVLQHYYTWAERLGAYEFFQPYGAIAAGAGRSTGWTHEVVEGLLGAYVDVVEPGLPDTETATIWRVLPPPGHVNETTTLESSRATNSNLPNARIGGEDTGARFFGGDSKGMGEGDVQPDLGWMFSERKRSHRGRASSSSPRWDRGRPPGPGNSLPSFSDLTRLDHRHPAFRDGSGTLRVALTLASGGPLTQEDIERLGVPRSTVSWTLRRLFDQGLVRRSGRHYSLTASAFVQDREVDGWRGEG